MLLKSFIFELPTKDYAWTFFPTNLIWRVLVFPPVSNFRRFLIHKLIEESFPLLKTFSVGEGDARRTVICFKVDFKLQNTVTEAEPVKQPSKRARTMPSVGIYRPPAARKLEQLNVTNSNFHADTIPPRKSNDNCIVSSSPPGSVAETKVDTKPCEKTGKKRRPDMAVYVPRGQRIAQEHRRKLDAISLSQDGVELQLTHSSFEDLESAENDKARVLPSVIINDNLPSSNDGAPKAINSLDSKSNVSNNDVKINVEVTLTSISSDNNSVIDHSGPYKDDIESDNSNFESCNNESVVKEKEFPGKSSPLEAKVNSSDIKETKIVPMHCSSDFEKPAVVLPKKTNENVNRDELDWDVLYDDEGECLEPSVMGQLTNAVGQVLIETPKSSYDDYKYRNLEDEFPHVVEVFNFPAEFKTPDLVMVFSEFKNSGFEIKWVDDTHALGIFSNSAIVSQVLCMQHPFVKTRCLSEGSQQSKLKARRCADSLTPYMTRPDTCAALARRLVTGALGVKLPTQRAEREAERKLLREAREKKRLAAKQREEAWEGTFS